jgi:hypothetical protein
MKTPTDDKTLHLNLKKKWFDLIAAGKKKEEYREIKHYWCKRLLLDDNGDRINTKNAKDLCEALKYAVNPQVMDQLLPKEALVPYDKIIFKNGYSKNAPTLIVQFKGIIIGNGQKELGANEDSVYFKIQLGKILYKKHL